MRLDLDQQGVLLVRWLPSILLVKTGASAERRPSLQVRPTLTGPAKPHLAAPRDRGMGHRTVTTRRTPVTSPRPSPESLYPLEITQYG